MFLFIPFGQYLRIIYFVIQIVLLYVLLSVVLNWLKPKGHVLNFMFLKFEVIVYIFWLSYYY